MKISIEDLYKSYGGNFALDHLNLEIADGELFFLLGPSGCGKTTLLRCIGGFELPQSGVIAFDGKDVANQPPNLRNAAMVFQGYALWPHLTVYENVAFGLKMRKLPKDEIEQRVRKAMESVQIWEYRDRKPNELSGGQQQRVALARTLVVQPGCLLLDEPLANLDAKLRRDMRSEIRRLCKENHLTAIYVTHDRSEALTMADRMAIMKDGRIVQMGTPEEIYRKPKDAFVATFLGDANIFKGTAKGNGKVACEFGEILAAENVEAGHGVDVMIRPEAISLQSAVDDNVIDATMVSSEYLGEIAQHRAKAGECVFEFLELNPKTAMAAGMPVKLRINREDVHLMEK